MRAYGKTRRDDVGKREGDRNSRKEGQSMEEGKKRYKRLKGAK